MSKGAVLVNLTCYLGKFLDKLRKKYKIFFKSSGLLGRDSNQAPTEENRRTKA